MSKSQVRAGRLLLWQKNHFNSHINWSDCGGTALVVVSRFFLIVVVNNISAEVQRKRPLIAIYRFSLAKLIVFSRLGIS